MRDPRPPLVEEVRGGKPPGLHIVREEARVLRVVRESEDVDHGRLERLDIEGNGTSVPSPTTMIPSTRRACSVRRFCGRAGDIVLIVVDEHSDIVLAELRDYPCDDGVEKLPDAFCARTPRR